MVCIAIRGDCARVFSYSIREELKLKINFDDREFQEKLCRHYPLSLPG